MTLRSIQGGFLTVCLALGLAGAFSACDDTKKGDTGAKPKKEAPKKEDPKKEAPAKADEGGDEKADEGGDAKADEGGGEGDAKAEEGGEEGDAKAEEGGEEGDAKADEGGDEGDAKADEGGDEGGDKKGDDKKGDKKGDDKKGDKKGGDKKGDDKKGGDKKGDDKAAGDGGDKGGSASTSNIDAKAIYMKKCKNCHGVSGAADTKIGQKNDIPSWKEPGWKGKWPLSKIKNITTNGKSGTKMKAFKNKLSPEEIEAVSKYSRSLGK